MATDKRNRIGFIGGGNMAEAILRGLLDAGGNAGDISVGEPLAKRRTQLRRRYSVVATNDNAEVAAASDVLVLAVKPQAMDEALASLADVVGKRHLLVSIAAGVRLARLESALADGVRVLRVMPNTPCLVGRGASVLCPGRNARAADVRRARNLFATVGTTQVASEEADMDAVTGLSGSGPAYVYYLAEALIAGGVAAGLTPKMARELTYETIAGAAEMMIQTGQDPADLRAAVSSPGGTTLAGLARLDRGEFFATVSAAVGAAAERSKELAEDGG